MNTMKIHKATGTVLDFIEADKGLTIAERIAVLEVAKKTLDSILMAESQVQAMAAALNNINKGSL